MNRRWMRVGITLIFLGALAAVYAFGLFDQFTFENLKSQREQMIQTYQEHRFFFLFGYFVFYVIVTAFSLPAATLLTLGAGAVFGLWIGLVLVSFASTIGATLAFFGARFVLRDWVKEKVGKHLETINQGIKRDGAFYLFTLRLVPIFPFFLINLVMGLTSLRGVTYFCVSQLGMFPGTLVYVNAGTQLAQIESLDQIFSLKLGLSFAAIGVLPWISKALVGFLQMKRSHSSKDHK